MQLALNATPQGMPVLSFLMLLTLPAAALLDALRRPRAPWFRWLLPLGALTLVVAVATRSLPLVIAAATLLGAGLGLTNHWRWTRRP
ncbi:hypothetical protein ACFWP2_25775 [Kitasatospora sp. NPDC058444]|uniref:hypothetical protein n=1 Tax=Kitasatospora sp. NPDC058444 TaxID=3346504 RepID=UPI003651CC3F